jgi:hypothetical protein
MMRSGQNHASFSFLEAGQEKMSIHGAHSLLMGTNILSVYFPSISLGHSLTFGEKTDILFLSLRGV